MAELLAFVKRDQTGKAETTLKADFDVAARQSITVRDAKALGVNLEGSIFYITGGDEGVAKCKEMLKPFMAEAKKEDLDKARKKIHEEQDAAASGLGGIFG